MPAPSPSTDAPTVQPSAPPVAQAEVASTDAAAADRAKRDRCTVLMAQGQSALAQAEGCGGDDQPIFAGSLLSLTQTGAPASRTLPDGSNRFAALSVYLAPRLTLSSRWALIADVTMAHEQTVPDDTSDRQEVQFTDPRLLAVGNLGKLAGFSFTASPRITIPVSAPSRKAKAALGTGMGLNIIRTFDVLEGLALVAGGTYNHTFARNVVRTSDDVSNRCNDISGSKVTCPISGVGIVQDAFRVSGTASLNFTSKVSAQLQYMYGWNLVKKLSELPTSIPGVISDDSPVLEGEDELDRDVSRWRKLGSLTLAVNYQAAEWVTATLQGNTSVCYNVADGMQSSLGGCAGGAKTSDFWLRNPIANKFSTLALSFTIPLDIVYTRIKNREGEEKRSAQKRSASKL